MQSQLFKKIGLKEFPFFVSNFVQEFRLNTGLFECPNKSEKCTYSVPNVYWVAKKFARKSVQLIIFILFKYKFVFIV